MKKPIKKICSFLILATAFALTLAVAGNVLASPCLNLTIYNNPDGTSIQSCEGVEVPYFPGTTTNSYDTGVLLYERLWFGTDSNGLNSKAWDWKLDNDYKAVLVGGLINTGTTTAMGGVRLVFLNNSYYLGLNDSATLQVFNPFINTAFLNNPTLRTGGGGTFDQDHDPHALYTDVFFPMQPGVVYPFRVEYAHIATNGFAHDGFDFRFIDGGAIEAFATTCPPQQVPVPEPTTMLLLGSGLVGLAGLKRRFSKS